MSWDCKDVCSSRRKSRNGSGIRSKISGRGSSRSKSRRRGGDDRRIT